jgi:hypothetical protein
MPSLVRASKSLRFSGLARLWLDIEEDAVLDIDDTVGRSLGGVR